MESQSGVITLPKGGTMQWGLGARPQAWALPRPAQHFQTAGATSPALITETPVHRAAQWFLC